MKIGPDDNTATHCNALQHAATFNALENGALLCNQKSSMKMAKIVLDLCPLRLVFETNVLQYVLQCVAKGPRNRCVFVSNVLQDVLQCVAQCCTTCCSALQKSDTTDAWLLRRTATLLQRTATRGSSPKRSLQQTHKRAL
mmetsp:Transcript_52707/g.77169  ORF Transcript_52707/g.77169 Transcript_52707/m.77169 type:complete len:140 (+) Transcript_52707:312-731(+)